MKTQLTILITLGILLFSGLASAAEGKVGITRSMHSFEGTINGEAVSISRNQDTTNKINPAFAKTSRPCPPFCIQPMQLAPGVETVGELEVLDYLKKMAAGDDSIMLIDSRTPGWVAKGTIPGARNIPWVRLNPAKGADPISIGDILTGEFGARELEGLWDFSNAKTLVLFCNGNWCGQSPNNIENLLRFGYPAHKLKWYRGGMQSWESLGLSTPKTLVHVETLIHARWVLPVTSGHPVLEQHSIGVENGRIAAILPTAEAQQQLQAARTVNLPRHALIPGLINAHTHAAMSLFRGLADDLPLMTWLNEHIWPAEAKWVREEFVADGTRLAVAEMLRSGTTCFNDMYFFPDVSARVAQAAGIRSVVGLILIDFPSAWGEGPDDYLHKAIEVHDSLRNQPLVSTAFAPHAPYSVSDEPLSRMLTLDNELEIPVHIHLHETVDEVAQGVEQHGMRPIERLHKLGLINPSLVAVHMTQLEPQEIELFARSGAHVVHCPQSNLKLASGFCPVQQLLDAGINVALGTDSAASNNDLDMLSEMQTAALLGKGVAKDASALPAHQVLQMATLNGARALGLEAEIGSLELGKQADVVAIDLGQLNTQPLFNPVSQIVYAAGREQVSDVWVAGRRLLANGQLNSLDQQAIATSATRWHARITGKYLDGPAE